MKRSLEPRFRSKALIYDIEIGEFVDRAVAFERDLSSALGPAAFRWYPYDSVGTLSILDRLLTGPSRFLRTLIGPEPILDLGCGDGLLSFAFEALGIPVHAVDNPRTNYNGMRGIKTLKRALRSAVRIHAMDLDCEFGFPVGHAGLALFFGTLYHLKNPLGVLDALSHTAQYCLLSTATTRFAPDQRIDLRDIPVACLAGREGLKGDDTNYWIFTEAGLRVLVDRAGWEVCDWLNLDDTEKTLWGAQRDNRVFCLLRSREFPVRARAQLVTGWHHLECSAWRWTSRHFSVDVPAGGWIKLHCIVPPGLPCPITLTSRAGTTIFAHPGDYHVKFAVSPGVVEFDVDPWLNGASSDGRERGLIVQAIEEE